QKPSKSGPGLTAAQLVDVEMGLPRRLWDAVASGRGQHHADGTVEIDPVSDRDVHRIHLALGPHRGADDLAAMHQVGPRARFDVECAMLADEQRLGTPEARPV